jgi:Domain of unknown function (DUF4365)
MLGMEPLVTSRPPQHESGDFGERYVTYHLPAGWVIHAYKGSEDYGLDFHVEVFSDGRPTGLEFGIQVKTMMGSISSTTNFTLTKNNLLYIVAKPYPTMVVVVSRTEKRAIYSWVQEMFSDNDLVSTLRGTSKRSKLRISLDPFYDFIDAKDSIVAFLQRRTQEVESWLATAAHTHLLVNIYLDIHAALDALIECVSVIHRNDRTDDEVSHKATYSFTLTVMAYGCLYWITRPERIAVLGPIGPTMTALHSQYRSILSEMLSEKSLHQYETNGSDDNPIIVLPAKTSPFFPAVPRLACVVRDVLRTIAVFMSPSRDFTMRMSGLAGDIIEYNSRKQSDGTHN